MKTHNTQVCRIVEKNSEESSNKVDLKGNKSSTHYKCLFHDSGKSKTMVNFTPSRVQETETVIHTAGTNQEPELGTAMGEINFGGINLEVIQVPTFTHSLVSATQLSREHGCRQVIEPWTANLTITKNNKLVATGKYDESTKLIKINLPQETALKSTETDWKTIHRRMGHQSTSSMRKILKQSTGIPISDNIYKALDCDDCLTTKSKRK
jgi:hypothetical protein